MAPGPSAADRETYLVVGTISASQLLNHAYLVLFPPVLALVATDFGVTVGAVGLALGVQGATNTLFQLPFGTLADRSDRTIALALSSLAGGVGVVGVAVAPTFEWFLVGQGLVGVGVAGHHPSHYPLLTDATPEELRGRVFSVYGVGGSLGFAAPPALMAAVVGVGAIGWREPVAAVGLVGIAYGLFVTWLFARRVGDAVTAPNRAADEPAVGTDSLRARARRELRALTASRGVLALAALALVTSTASWGFTAYVVVFLQRVYGLGLDLANVALTGSFVVGAVAILVGGALTDRVAPGPVMVAGFGGFFLLVAALATGAVTPLVAVGCVLVVGGVRSLAGPARDKLTEALAGGGAAGTSFAIVSVGIMLGNAVAPPTFGYLLDRYGAMAAFWAVAAVALAGVAITAYVVLRWGQGGFGTGEVAGGD